MNTLEVTLWSMAIGCGVMAGVYFTFSAFVMSSLDAIPRREGIAAMQSINRVILESPFIALFFATSLVSAAVVAWGIVNWGQPGSIAMIAGGAIYVLGMFVCTAAGNVPLNNALDAVDPATREAADVWSHYMDRWTFLNHIRTVASAASSGLFIAALRGIL